MLTRIKIKEDNSVLEITTQEYQVGTYVIMTRTGHQYPYGQFGSEDPEDKVHLTIVKKALKNGDEVIYTSSGKALAFLRKKGMLPLESLEHDNKIENNKGECNE